MKMAYDEDQQLMQKTAREFVTGQSPVSRMRALRDSGDAIGYSPELWKEMAQLGWVGVNLPESYGGSAMGFADLCLLLEETGRCYGQHVAGSSGASSPGRQPWRPSTDPPMLSTGLAGSSA